MKRRKGFVSNSSSSSYVTISRAATIDEIDDPKVKISIGWGSDGEYYGRPTNDQIRWMKDNRGNYKFDLYYEYFSASDGTEIKDNNDVDFAAFAKILLAPQGTGAVIHSREVDYHFPYDDLEHFKDLATRNNREMW